MKDRISLQWLQAIEDATVCLRSRQDGTNNIFPHYQDGVIVRYEQSLFFLNELEAALQKNKGRWSHPPPQNPPSWQDYVASIEEIGEFIPPSIPPPALFRNSNHENSNRSISSNPFATLELDTDDDDEDSLTVDDDDDEAGDHPTLNLVSSSDEEVFDKRRVLIRILTSQSEVYAAKANTLRKHQPQQWAAGAAQYSFSLERINKALALADAAISRWFSAAQDAAAEAAAPLLPEPKALVEDANIVAVAIQFLTTERDRYWNAAQQQERALLRKLQPQWESRDQIKEKMGDRWFHNPHPKGDYAAMRAEAEAKLQDVRKALEDLENLDVATAQQASQMLTGKLQGSGTETNTSRRYNGQRPDVTNMSKRVSIELYPDPTEFGWTFTGSWGVAEFFEREDDNDGDKNAIVKLDWYFTTATVKTSLDHPVQGKTQLFGAHVDPETYRAILINPRAHTGHRYHYRAQRSKKFQQ